MVNNQVSWTSTSPPHAAASDVSHMGEVTPRAQTLRSSDYLVSNDARLLTDRRFTPRCAMKRAASWTIFIYRRTRERYLVVVNASNTDKDYAHMPKVAAAFKSGHAAPAEQRSPNYTQLPFRAQKPLKLYKITDTPLSPVKYYWFTEGKVLGSISRARSHGVYGRDGFEIYVP